MDFFAITVDIYHFTSARLIGQAGEHFYGKLRTHIVTNTVGFRGVQKQLTAPAPSTLLMIQQFCIRCGILFFLVNGEVTFVKRRSAFIIVS